VCEATRKCPFGHVLVHELGHLLRAQGKTVDTFGGKGAISSGSSSAVDDHIGKNRLSVKHGCENETSCVNVSLKTWICEFSALIA